MEKFAKEKIQTEREVLGDFQKEIQQLKEEEDRLLSRNKETPVHLRGVIPEELTREDAAVYQKLKDGSLGVDEFTGYRKKFEAGGRKQHGSRFDFAGFIGNKLFGRVLEADAQKGRRHG